jgi:predicted DNA-binding helix-hairpin-helix protein
MLIQQTPGTFEKVQALGSMATDDVLSPPAGATNVLSKAPYSVSERNPIPGVYRAQMPDGKSISLLRVMFTDFCKMDCHYCPNSHWVPRKRFSFKVDELAGLFHDMQSREVVAGLFLSSGVAGSGSKTTEKLLQVVETIRKRHGFTGYIHMKVMPGTERHLVEEAYRLATRVSVNIETPTVAHMHRLSRMKDLERDILDPMRWVVKLDEQYGDGAAGQATQMVVGAAGESDRDIYLRMDQLYRQWKLKRVYYVNFRPVRFTPLEEHAPPHMAREGRLYQMDWLRRVYGFSDAEMERAFDGRGFLSLEHNPKMVVAMENIAAFPVDLNAADRQQLLRVPGIGPTAAERIVRARRRHRVGAWHDLQAMGVVKKWSWPFVTFPGHRPDPGRQLRLDLFREAREAESEIAAGSEGTASPALPALVRETAAAYAAVGVASGSIYGESGTPGAGIQVAPCGEARSCNGCPLYGAPGHPGPDDVAPRLGPGLN